MKEISESMNKKLYASFQITSIIISLFACTFIISNLSFVSAEAQPYTVVKGDTLSDICQ